jgi:DNA-binding NarL/FixJ family response regulator
MEAAKLLIADDHPLFRAALALAIRELSPDTRIVEASSFASLEAAIAANPDVELVLLDLTMPGAMGFSSLVYLRGERPEVPVVVVSANDHPRTVRRAQQFGAAGFISKSAPMSEMHQAIGTVMEGGEWFPAPKAGKSEADARLAAQLAQLTPQQLRVLMYVAEGLLNKQIAYKLGAAENTVKVHVTAILRKLECHGRTQLAVLVKGLEADAATDVEESG